MALATRPKPKVQHKKRQARHHRQSKTYLKSYWPYLPMLLIVGFGFFLNNALSSTAVLGASSDFSSSSLLTQTNIQRNKNDEPPLTIDPQLSTAAQAKAEDMVKQNYWAHNSPDGKTPWTFITAAGYQYEAAGENLAYGFDGASETINGWMNSTEHKENLLNAGYQHVGFGVASATNYLGHGPEIIIVAEYGRPVQSAANISFNVNNPATAQSANQVKGANKELAAKPISRIQVLTGGKATWSVIAVSAIAGAAFALFIARHGLRLRRWMVEGEAFIAHHPFLDIAIVFIFTAGFLLTRSSGVIK